MYQILRFEFDLTLPVLVLQWADSKLATVANPFKMALSSPKLGGYDYEFVEPPPDDLICLICTFVAKDPQQLTCCGKIYCQVCLEEQQKCSNRCAQCRKVGAASFEDQRSKSQPHKSLDYKIMIPKWLFLRYTYRLVNCRVYEEGVYGGGGGGGGQFLYRSHNVFSLTVQCVS